MGPLVVPMDPAFFPEAGLLVAGVFTGVAAIAVAVMRRRSSSEEDARPDRAGPAALGLTAVRLAAASLACFALVFVMARTLHGPPKPKPTPHGPRTASEAPADTGSATTR